VNAEEYNYEANKYCRLRDADAGQDERTVQEYIMLQA
jgi:hypothetical protein